ncbi:exosortase [Marinobacter salinus]|uniref:Exosortase n=1 Tax=Marinobacter salinus TaxID=1874317 RepID=A0A1D9GR99_9GAMM|nr:exosortase [Marinobacter salinus]
MRRLSPPHDDLAGVDAYVRQHPGATPYHRSAWLKAVNEGYKHSGTILAAFDDTDDIVGVLPLCHLALPLGRPALISQPYCDLGGPLANNASVAQALIEEAKRLASDVKASSLSLRLAGPALDIELKHVDAGMQKVSMLCELPHCSETLFKSYKPKLRSQIRKAEKNGLSGEVRQDPEAVEAFYHVFAANMRRLGSPVHALRWFSALHSHYGADMVVGLVYCDGVVVGAGVVLLNGKRASIPWASTLAEYNHLAPNMLLYWTLLSYVCDRGITLFDFGRSTPGEGTYRFKKQWGAVPHELNWLDILNEGTKTSAKSRYSVAAQKLRALVEVIWRRLPLPVANRFGPLIRKYISL